MEHHESVYEQIIEVSNGNEGDIEFQHYQHEIVQDANIDDVAGNCEVTGIEIMLSNDCDNVQDQCDGNVMPPSCDTDEIGQNQMGHVILHQDQINNVDDNITNYNESHKKDKVEQYILHNQSPYHSENFEVNNTVVVVTNPEIGNEEIITETIIESSDTVPLLSENESVPDLTHSQSIDNHNVLNNSKNYNEVKSKSGQKLDQGYIIQNRRESYSSLVKSDTIEAMEVDTTSIGENVVIVTMEESEMLAENHCVTDDDIKLNAYSNNSDINVKNEETISENSKHPVETDYSIMTETIGGSKIVMNSDDVAVLTEFNSMEYSTEEIVEEEEESLLKSDLNVVEIKLTETSQPDELKQESEIVVDGRSDNILKEEVKTNDTSKDNNELEEGEEEDDDELDLHLSTQSNEKQSKVIQDIFDDWEDENAEEGNNDESMAEHHDSVELELQSLLDGGNQQEQTATNDTEHGKVTSAESTPSKSKSRTDKVSPFVKTASSKSPNSNYVSAKEHSLGRSPKTPSQDQSDLKNKHQSPRPGVKVPGLHLTSQIASTAEVKEALKERLREKQKDLVSPKTADMVFVKKITQRLSSQLLSSVSQLTNVVPPPLVPLQSADSDSEADKSKLNVETAKSTTTSASDNNDLLAILEGDVDPDWSNLKPNEESSSKLDPSIEREIALKQLLELPNVTSKKNSAAEAKKAKKTSKAESVKSADESKSVDSEDDSKTDIVSPNSSVESSPKRERKSLKENNNQNARSSAVNTPEHVIEESRSGRKRKLTEKAREHELSVKRQKVSKSRAITDSSKKSSSESEDSSGKQKTDSSQDEAQKTESESDEKESKPEVKSIKTEPKQTKPEVKAIKPEGKQQTPQSKAEAKANAAKGKLTPVKRPKLGLLKKDVPISKRKLAVKNLLRHKMTGKKTAVNAKTKVQVSTTNKASSEKSSPASASPTKGKKNATEIDRLLQDEGVVNLLYDVEQPDSRRRLVPITKSQKKVMDMDKAERELKLRTKMVRNAVLRLRNSTAPPLKILSRSRRSATATSSAEQSPAPPEKKAQQNDATTKPNATTAKSSTSPLPSEFIIPAKIRNAADASRIIRRHSSSSFSSASASPRVSIDQPPDGEPESQAKSRRKLSNESIDKLDTKKNKKKVNETKETSNEKTEKTPVKKEPVKKLTRSNNVAAASATPTKVGLKNKKVPKSKTSSTDSLASDVVKSPRSQEELSACLAEAASALSSTITTSSSRTSSTAGNRKKGSTNLLKISDDEKSSDVKKLFSNKEINIKRHGHLVQLILTPSAPVSGIRNAITIQVMNELRETLTILRNDEDCRVVLFTSTGTSFCEGLELSLLLHSSKEERQKRAEEMANAVRMFIKALAAFNKPIVAGVQGAAIGLGVTMLPLFDLVIASDKATFSTPYGKLGQIAEGAAVLSLSHSLGSAATNELLLGGRTLTASEALRAGLVTRVLWPDRFQGELLPSLKSMSEQSSQSMEATKALLRYTLRKKLDNALDSESFLLVQHWISNECQEAIKLFIEEKGQ